MHSMVELRAAYMRLLSVGETLPINTVGVVTGQDAQTIRLMGEIDAAILSWPIE